MYIGARPTPVQGGLRPCSLVATSVVYLSLHRTLHVGSADAVQRSISMGKLEVILNGEAETLTQTEAMLERFQFLLECIATFDIAKVCAMKRLCVATGTEAVLGYVGAHSV